MLRYPGHDDSRYPAVSYVVQICVVQICVVQVSVVQVCVVQVCPVTRMIT